MAFNKYITVNSPHVKYDKDLEHLNVDYEYSHTKADRLAGGLIQVSIIFAFLLSLIRKTRDIVWIVWIRGYKYLYRE